MLYHLQLDFKSIISNMTVILIPQYMCLMQFIIIYKKKYKTAIFVIFTGFHLKSPQSLHSQNLSRVRNLFICLLYYCKWIDRRSLLMCVQCLSSSQWKLRKCPFFDDFWSKRPKNELLWCIHMLVFAKCCSASISV